MEIFEACVRFIKFRRNIMGFLLLLGVPIKYRQVLDFSYDFSSKYYRIPALSWNPQIFPNSGFSIISEITFINLLGTLSISLFEGFRFIIISYHSFNSVFKSILYFPFVFYVSLLLMVNLSCNKLPEGVDRFQVSCDHANNSIRKSWNRLRSGGCANDRASSSWKILFVCCLGYETQ